MVDAWTDEERIRQTDRWPLRPWLPMARNDDTGLIHEQDVRAHGAVRISDGSSARDYDDMLAGEPPEDDPDVRTVRRHDDSLRAFLAAGWRVRQ